MVTVGGASGAEAATWLPGRVALSDGVLAYHRAGGPGPPLVLSHGLTDNGLCWRRLAEVLAGEFDVILLDARGHGDSARIAEGASFDPAADLAEAIERLELVAPIVMGHSVGAWATAAYANAFPERPAKVILEDPAFLPPTDPTETARRRARFRRQVEEFHALSDAELLAVGKSVHAQWSDEEFPDWVAAKRQVDPEAMPHYSATWQESIADIAAPTLLIHGDADLGGMVTPKIAAEAAAINANIQLAHVPSAGHNIRRENLSGFLAAVREFLRAD